MQFIFLQIEVYPCLFIGYDEIRKAIAKEYKHFLLIDFNGMKMIPDQMNALDQNWKCLSLRMIFSRTRDF